MAHAASGPQEVRKFKTMAAQGDLMLIRVGSIPTGLEKAETEDGKYIVAHSETGHHHVLEATKNVEVFDVPNDELRSFIHIENMPAMLVHERDYDTHAPIQIDPGMYELRRQREYSAGSGAGLTIKEGASAPPTKGYYMRVKIGDTWYGTENGPIMVQFNNEDIQNVQNFDPRCDRYAVFKENDPNFPDQIANMSGCGLDTIRNGKRKAHTPETIRNRRIKEGIVTNGEEKPHQTFDRGTGASVSRRSGEVSDKVDSSGRRATSAGY